MTRTRTILAKATLWVAAFALAAPLVAQVEPAVRPGGDIPRDFDVPNAPRPAPSPGQRFSPPAASYQYVRREVRIPMRDGVRLHTVLILPKGAARAPIILDRTPYSADKETNVGFGPWPENILTPMAAELVRAGYIVAVQDVRGKFRSEGDYVMNRPLRGPLNPTAVDHSTDAYDTIDWLVKHVPETNRSVATMGVSYNGFTALMALVQPHPALKAAVPINPMVDVWKGDDWFHNGAFRQEMASFVYGQTVARNSAKEWFPSARDNYRAFLRAGSADAYAKSVGMDRLPFWRRLVRHPAYGEYWKEQALDRILAKTGLTVPTLIVGSLWDQEDIYGAPALFAAVKGSGKASLVLGPWYHGQANGPALSLGPLHFGVDTGRWFRANILMPFLNHHLKGGPAPDIARATVFDAGPNQWRRLPDWPRSCRQGCGKTLTALHFASGRRLDFAASATAGYDSYVADPARPVPYRPVASISPWAPNSSWRFWLVDDQSFASKRPDVLTYVSDPLDRPLRLAGHPVANLVASTSGSDSDWVVKLIDVFPPGHRLPGYQLPIAMEILRGRYRSDPARPQSLVPNQPLGYQITLPAVSYTVPAGHRLMVQVQSSWFPLYDRNPQTFVPNIFTARKGDYRPATQRIAYGPGGSWIGLPIVE